MTPAQVANRFGLRKTAALLWHLSNNWGHGRSLFYDVRSRAVRCGACRWHA